MINNTTYTWQVPWANSLIYTQQKPHKCYQIIFKVSLENEKKNHFLYTSTCQKEFNLYSTLLIWFDLMHMTTLSNISYNCKNYLAMNMKCRFKYFTTIWPGKAECLAYWHWRHYRLQKAAWTCSWCENPSFSLSTIFQSKSALIRKTNYDKVHIWLSVLSVSNDEGLLFIKKKL